MEMEQVFDIPKFNFRNYLSLVMALVDPLPKPQILLYFTTGEKKAQIDCGT